MNVLDLFSGIGGFSLGLERAGMRTVAFCEIDPYCRRVLAKHWPDVPVYGDIRELTAAVLMGNADIASQDAHASPGPSRQATGQSSGIDVICGGFPCQDISVAGKGAGIGGERSGLWSEYARIIGEVRPRYVIVENVAALLGRGLATVLGDLAALGFDAEWHCIPASAVGAPHRRDRVWIVAYAARGQPEQPAIANQREGSRKRCQWLGVGTSCGGAERYSSEGVEVSGGIAPALGDDVADANGTGRQQQWRRLPIREELAAAQCGDWWQSESGFCRVAHGVPARVDRLRALGNAVVPQIPEIIGRAIMRVKP